MKLCLVFAICLVAGAGGTAVALAQDKPGPAACPDKLEAGRIALHCTCPSETTATGSVWGDETYTDDSAICRAALHAGAIGTGGGEVLVVEAPGRESYPAVTRNSVASSSWPQWRRSIAFRPVGEARPADVAGLETCPFAAGGRAVGTELDCRCGAEATQSGAVWGSGPYTADSAICRAALHAGAIGRGGGEVRLRVVAGRDSYPAGSRNGVAASNWGSFSSSIEFRR